MKGIKYDEVSAVVRGTTEEGKDFTTQVYFKLLRPTDNDHYGNGCYLRVKLPSDTKLVDVRYGGCTEVDILADRWIKDYFGTNAKEIEMHFTI